MDEHGISAPRGIDMAIMRMQFSALISVLHREGVIPADAVLDHFREQSVVAAVHLGASDQAKAGLSKAMKALQTVVDSLGAFDCRR